MANPVKLLNGKMIGMSQFLKNISNFGKKFQDHAAQALYQEAQIEMTESKRRVPVNFGTLRATGTVHQPVRRGREITVELSYGTDYAVYVHEDLEAFHRTGRARYLASVLEESRAHMGARLAKRMNFNQGM